MKAYLILDLSITDILCSPAIRKTQDALGSCDMIARSETGHRWKSELSAEQTRFIQSRDSFYLGTASQSGRPYIQHRGAGRKLPPVYSAPVH
jgi:hypothetical protein